MDFSRFDSMINKDQLQKDIADAANNTEYAEVKKGKYLCDLERLELGETKDGRPCLKAMLRILGDAEGNKSPFNKHCVFMNRVVYGTKNDANMISSAIGWLKSLKPSEEVFFESYTQFSELVMDIAEELIDNVELQIEYNPDAFNNIHVIDVFDK